ncbi:MAG: FAD-dependent oxidoreductase [Pseudomonadota bacterium]
MSRIAVIGAGLTGLTCAKRLAEAGHAPVVLDKGRGIGGRLATRRAEGGFQFDHGAQYLSAKTTEFAAFLGELAKAGVLGLWDHGTGRANYAGVPGMRSIAQWLAQGLEVRSLVEASRVEVAGDRVVVAANGEVAPYDHVVLTVPAPQVPRLIGEDHALAAQISDVRMTPNLTLMAGFAGSMPAPFKTERDAQADLSWIARDDSKPGRGAHACWVAQAGLDWSVAHLDLPKEEIAAKMLPLLCARIGTEPGDVSYLAGHRWRYAQASEPLGTPFLKDASGRLRIGGDWCLGARAEQAWQSGHALADDLLNAL